MEVFNREKALAQVGHDQGLLEELIDSFRTEYRQWRKQLHRALDDGTEQEVETTAHTIKGAADTIGADEVTEVARQIEERGRRGELEGVDTTAAKLEEAVDRLERTLDDEL